MECLNTQSTHLDLGSHIDLSRTTNQVPTSAALTQLLKGGTVSMHYQPQFCLQTGNVRGLESLLRARDLNDNALNPAELVNMAERRGLIHELGDQILAAACADYAAMRSLGCEVGRLAVNISPLQLIKHDFAERVLNIVDQHGIDYADIELEVIESWSLLDPELHLEQLQNLADLGFQLALDDFGSGHANWLTALRLPFNTLKIDRSLMQDVESNPDSIAVIESICQACTELNMDVVAEGVSNAEQLRLLKNVNCQSGQGFGLAMPMAPSEAMDVKPLIAVSLIDSPALSAKS